MSRCWKPGERGRSTLLVSCIVLGSGSGVVAVDCDRNGRDDREDLKDGAPDCNGNGVLDACDLLPQGYLVTPSDLAVYKSPGPPVAADLDGDGRVDIVSANDTRLVTVLWNDGVLKPAGYVTHQGSTAVAAGDLDADGDIDILSPGDAKLSLVRNLGGRTLAPDPPAADIFPVRPRSIALVDLDRDGDLDAALAGGSDIHLLRNDGAGTCSPWRHVLADGGPIAIFPVDLDADGRLDFVTGNLLGTFTIWPDLAGGGGEPVLHESGRTNAAFAMADFDRSGAPDIAAVNHDGSLEVHLYRGGGVFSRESYTLDGEPTAIAAADLDGDGDFDLAVADAGLPLRVFKNRGDGTFHRPASTGAAVGATSILPVDIDGDATLDIVAPARSRDLVHLLEGRVGPDSLDCNRNGVPDDCDVKSGDCDANGIPDSCDSASTADCDGNGVPDHCDTDCDRNGVTDACDIAAGVKPDCNANGVPDGCDVIPLNFRFEREESYPLQFEVMANGSFIRSGRAELVVGSIDHLWILSHLPFVNGRSSYTFEAVIPVGERITAVAAADADGDGRGDAASVAGSGVFRIARNVAEQRFDLGAGIQLPIGPEPPADVLVFGDLDADGDLDGVAGAPGGIVPVANDRGGAFRSGTVIPGPRAWRSLWIGDLSGDGLPEVGAAGADGELAVFPNEAGRLGAPPRRAFQGLSGDLAGGDADGDGDVDLIAARSSPGRVSIILNDGGDRYSEGFVLELPAAPAHVDAADLDGDGDLDVACTYQEAAPPGTGAVLLGRVKVLLGGGDGRFEDAVTHGIALDQRAVTFAIGDADGNGSPDLIVGAGIDCEDCALITENILHLRNLSSPPSSRDGDGNGVPDDCQGGSFRRGDVAADARLDLADPLSILGHLFRGEPAPRCLEAADADDDGVIRLTDAIFILGHLFLGGPAPPEPGPPPRPCGFEAAGSPASLGCVEYAVCR